MQNKFPSSDSLPESGPLLAIDWGRAKIGLAITDGLQISANPMAAIRWLGSHPSHEKNFEFIIEAIGKIFFARKISGIIIGLPVSLNGSLGSSAQEVFDFVNKLKKRISCPIFFQDESFSSIEASQRLAEFSVSKKKKKEIIDSISAVIILESYLRRHY